MEKTTPDKIRHGLKSYIQNLYGHQLYDLVQIVKSAETLEQLPSHLKDALGLRRYFLTRNLLETIQEQLLELIPWRCMNGDLVAPEHSIWMANQTLQRRALRSPSPPEIPRVVQNYFKYFHCQMSVSGKASVSIKLYEEKGGNNEFYYISVEGSRLVLSEVKADVEMWLDKWQLRDVHFLASDTFYVNCSLENAKWHGVDILVSANKVRCVPLANKSDYEEPSHLWNLSGQEGGATCPEKAPPGINGSPGLSGSNGGHLLFIAKEYENMSDLVVVSNGGRGGRGQHGGDGVDGVDGDHGAEWTVEEMFIRWPSSVASDALRALVVENTRQTEGLERFQYEPAAALDKHSGKVLGIVTDFYARGKLQTGVRFEVGFGKGVFQKTAFCLVSGAPGGEGSLGGPGGVGGIGGVGGQKGSVTLLYSTSCLDKTADDTVNNSVTVVLKPGRKGRMGVDGCHGVNGKTGRNGKDVGYMAWSGKEVSGFPPGKYQLKTVKKSNEDDESGKPEAGKEPRSRKQETVYSKLLDKHVSIEPRGFARIKSLVGNDSEVTLKGNEVLGKSEFDEFEGTLVVQRQNEIVKELLARIEKYKLMQRHARQMSLQQNRGVSGATLFTAEWWMRQILNA